MRRNPPEAILYFCQPGFHEANVELTNTCNFRCWFCPRRAMTRPRGFMSGERFRQLVLELDRSGLFTELAIAGIGEPTLHPELPELIDFTKKNTSLKVVLTTNGSSFVDQGYTQRLLASGADKITVSLRITTPERARQCLPARLPLDGYLDTIVHLIEENEKLGGKTEIELASFKETLYSRLILNIGRHDVLDARTLDRMFGEMARVLGRPLPSYRQRTSSFAALLSNVDRIPFSPSLSFRFDGLSSWTTAPDKHRSNGRTFPAAYGSCLGMQSHIAIYWNGDVSTCCADFDARNLLGNIFSDHDIRSILARPRALRWADELARKKMPTPVCRLCRGGATRREKWANIVGTLFYQRQEIR